MTKFIATICGTVLIASSVLGGAVTNTVKWNVPWGDAWRIRGMETLNAYETQINANKTSITALEAGGAMTDVTVSNATLTGKLKVVGTISNSALTASLPVFTDANKVLVSGTTGLAMTNGTIATTVMTNGTVGALTVVTNGTVSSFANATNIDNSATVAAATNGTISSVTFVTNGTIAVTLTVTANPFVYLDGSSNIVTNTFVTAVAVNTQTFTPETGSVTPTFTPQTANVLSSATLQTATVTPTLTPQTGSITPVITPQTGSVAGTLTPQTGTFAKP